MSKNTAILDNTNFIPTTAQKRIDLLDIFRGFAIFGIFIVNIEIMNCTFINQEVFHKQWYSNLDQLAIRILQLFFYSKFFPIFSFLFGLGIAMQITSRIKNNTYSIYFFIRRMILLFIFGVLHIIFLWSGDVIHLYAILGVFSIFLIKKSNTVLIWSVLLLLLFPFYEHIFGLFFEWIGFFPSQMLKEYSSENITYTIRYAPYIKGIQLRLLEYISNIPVLFFYLMPIALSMFILGIYFGKKNYINSIEIVVKKIKKPILCIAILSNIYRLIFLFILIDHPIYKNEIFYPIFTKLMVVSDIFMGLFYLWIIAWLIRYPIWKKIFIPFTYVGRMALTNYILHSLIGLFIFSSIGLQLYETLSPYETTMLAIAVFTLQVVFSKIWLDYFNYGPLEWIWRCFSYKKILPIKKNKPLA
ncbi:DUF418 domain-containing protein [Aquimarina muelleri]|uniref:Membrane protein n=1 Tax=Aquimarina muelleri TaxID=279356 RepID=A0A918N3P3_9FLAO|nr:DUF418 domain-containing protein [Aquimarina muelleri]MCX2764067.1 DUF418 domain-containing protein [Aquimarina muelleri]GGX28153.1 membrane protein [Aquimarina muelleri]